DIIHNAIKYTKSGGSVDISTRLEAGKAIIRIRDTGIGIPENEKSRVFTKFFRAKNAKDLYKNGSGLGMYISKSIITRHNGSITLESKEGEGTVVEIFLPLLQSAPRENK
ncbi:MAG TPA: ATP-binding protein, partial [Candidatus Paceibacterota bacterium]|nr:ATP-binding protein [Candidatus Paceibacterota bacterium]